MSLSWSALTFTPDAAGLAALREEWSWILPESIEPLLFSIFGDLFFSDSTGKVFWLNTGTAEVEPVAGSKADFQDMLGTIQADDWFLPDLVAALHKVGKVPAHGECYTYAILPVFKEGAFEEWNFTPVPASQHFAVTAHMHKQLAGLPDGAQVKLSVQE